MRDFTKYDVWNNGIDFVVDIYEMTKNWPDEERFGLISQVRRAAVSIPSNFAEGCSRSSEKEFKRYLEIALGSAFEVKTQLVIASKLGFTSFNDAQELMDKLDLESKQINALRNKLKD
ncbi:four helix bundle protein [Marinoscillum sp.]|uniref:four helix bundle protein n=1 Tax=Marinoscillum sp. TaxID=2024838 RepID=UPI003BAC0A0A